MNVISSCCRSCGQTGLKSILSLGEMPLANALLASNSLDQPEPTYPLELVYCPHCTLVQITETIPPAELFREYFYFSSFSDTMLQHVKNLVERLILERHLSGNSLVVEIASNDGYLLQYYHNKGVPVLGIEPAVNVAQVAIEERGIPTLCEFFDDRLALRVKENSGQADIIHAHNVLAHVANLNGFVAGINVLLKDTGIAVIEVPYVKDLIDRIEFDTIYHEHLCYFSVTALDHLFRQHNLSICHIERIPIHGGSLRLFVQRDSTPGAINVDRPVTVRQFLVEETTWGVDNLQSYRQFAGRVENLKNELRSLLKDLKEAGYRLAAYGAAAKGSVLLNYLGIGQDILDFVADRSIYKQGHYMPGVHLPIYAPEKLLQTMPDYVLLLAWNFADEILQQQLVYRQKGGKFIIPLPEVQII